jgi:hypothetical protein
MRDREKALEAARVPLDELHADAAYLAHRIQQGSLSPDEVAKVIRAKIDAALTALAMPATERTSREADVAHAASVILTALHRAQIDMTILRKFLNGEPNAALTALANLTPPEDAPTEYERKVSQMKKEFPNGF